jgi:hypothetical protein
LEVVVGVVFVDEAAGVAVALAAVAVGAAEVPEFDPELVVRAVGVAVAVGCARLSPVSIDAWTDASPVAVPPWAGASHPAVSNVAPAIAPVIPSFSPVNSLFAILFLHRSFSGSRCWPKIGPFWEFDESLHIFPWALC